MPNSVRNVLDVVNLTLRAGLTGTRLQSGKPQPRFQESLQIARALARQDRTRGSQVLSLDTLWHRAVQSLELCLNV